MTVQLHSLHLATRQTLTSARQLSTPAAESDVREPASALSRLQDKALNAIARELPGMDAAGLKRLDPAEYTPEKVAERIATFVGLGLDSARQRGATDEELQSMHASAMRGAEQGFKEAKELLAHLQVLNGAVAEQVDATEKLTFEQLAKLSPALKLTEAAPLQTASATTSFAQASRYSEAQDFSLQLRTRDGDTVQIEFSRQFAAESQFAAITDGEGSAAMILDVSQAEQTGYQFRVHGDLSEEELTAIQNLVQDVSQVATEFYSGDVQQAFERTADLRFDNTQLASMRLSMSHTEQTSAVQRYASTQRLEQPEAVQHAGQRLGHLGRELRENLEPEALQFLNEPFKLVSDLLRGLVEQDSRFLSADAEQQTRYQDQLERLLKFAEPPAAPSDATLSERTVQ
ncbi:hypothetical protein SAMN05421644_11724 [Allochromatium warmingii]|uniref:DUF5610 domain-containing protein n=1 Tax=Allochromatium warmingii TaxID=61595 RepID=A0A1H3FBP2_ALLWA|nr:DUF5610 domain-containing protein [Allochromatium warmingii]SDX87569.1 hypothetical protein SAMN05421644_11724 [Allochromatium warmingii]